MSEPEMQNICNRLDTIEALLKSLVRQRMSNKQELLFDEVKKKGSLTVRNVMNFLNISRTHALTLMNKISDNPGFNFRKGNQRSREPSAIRYNSSQIISDRNKKISTLLNKKGVVTLSDIYTEFGITLEDAKLIVQDYLDSHKDSDLVNGIKLIRKSTVNSKSC